jgi:hypothetical protein
MSSLYARIIPTPDLLTTTHVFGDVVDIGNKKLKVHAEDGDLFVYYQDEEDEWIELGERCFEYWMGAVLFWHWEENWSTSNFQNAAIVSRKIGYVMTRAGELRRICDMDRDPNTIVDWDKINRNVDLYNYSKKVRSSGFFAEGAD